MATGESRGSGEGGRGCQLSEGVRRIGPWSRPDYDCYSWIFHCAILCYVIAKFDLTGETRDGVLHTFSNGNVTSREGSTFEFRIEQSTVSMPSIFMYSTRFRLAVVALLVAVALPETNTPDTRLQRAQSQRSRGILSSALLD